jgi:thiosulfate dehydrogenase [quinone] large subunit
MNSPSVRRVGALVAAVIGAILLSTAADKDTAAGTAITTLILGILLFGVVAAILQRYYHPGVDRLSSDEVPVREWKAARFLRLAQEAAPLYFGFRLYLGYEWIRSGRAKIDNPAWVDTGAALKGFWQSAVAVNEQGSGKIVYPAYRAFIQYMLDHEWYTWFGKVIAYGELLIGLGILLGGLTAVAASFGLLMNFSFIYAGSTSSNPTFIILEAIIIFGWRVAGWWGLDRWLFRWLGTPWDPGEVFERGDSGGTAAAQSPPAT